MTRTKKKAAGAKITYTDSVAATTTFHVLQKRSGRLSGKACKPASKRLAKAKRCTLFVLVKGTVAHADKAGANTVAFSGKVGGRKLKPGAYRLDATPLAGTKLGLTVSALFRVVR